MSYQALARQYRPSLFNEVVGQEHVVTALSNALDTDRIHHAFLFTGTRGVGKTTLARIFAKAMNCLTNGVSATPCGACSACTSISEGRFIDLIEVDAASRTKVEDTRDLLDNVQYAPTSGRYKVYLIDEVHMLSNSSFNALLKTLEEPPPHVKFLLATTDPQKLPVTVLSRCLQFNLKALSLEQIADHLTTIVGHESIDSDPPALRLLARSAEGSVRDSLSLLDQAIAYGNGTVSEQGVRDMLGLIDDRFVIDIVSALARGDTASVLETVALMAQRSVDFRSAFDELLVMLHGVALEQQVPGISDSRQTDSDTLRQLAGEIAVEDVQLFYQSALLGKRDLAFAPDGRTGFEMALLRMIAFQLPGSAPTNTDNSARHSSGQAGSAKIAQGASNARAQVPAAPVKRAIDAAVPESINAPGVQANASSVSPNPGRPSVGPNGSSKPNPAVNNPAPVDKTSTVAQPPQRQSTSKTSKQQTTSNDPEINNIPKPGTAETEAAGNGLDDGARGSISEHAAAIRLALNGGVAPKREHKVSPATTRFPQAADDNKAQLSPASNDAVKTDAPERKANNSSRPETQEIPESRGVRPAPAIPLTGTRLAEKSNWLAFIEASELEGAIREFAMNMAPQSFERNTLTMSLSNSHVWLLDEDRVKRLESMINERVSGPVKLNVVQVDARIESPAEDIRAHRHQRQQDAETAILADPNIAALCEQFGAQIVEGSIQPAPEKP